MEKTLAEMQPEFEKPFPVEYIDLLPKGKVERDGKTLCMGLAYADVRAYQDRLNALVPGEWSTPQPVALVVGQKLVVYVTIVVFGIPHTDVGEAAATSENAATESWAQGFKRACSQFGLGRYLYDLEKVWVPFNPQRKQIDLSSAEIARTVGGMYKKAGLRLNEDKNEERSQPTRVADSATAQKPELSPQQKEMRTLLDEFYKLSPATYARIPNWEEIAIRTALVLGRNGDLPTDYTDEQVGKMRAYITTKRQEFASKAS